MNKTMIDGIRIVPKQTHVDRRGSVTELFRSDELPRELQPVMAYASETFPGESRGPHEHADQTDHFIFIGPGDLELRLWDRRPDSRTFGIQMSLQVGSGNPCSVTIPPGVVHGYRCISEDPAWVFNFPNRLYAGENRLEPIDEIRHENDPGNPYEMD